MFPYLSTSQIPIATWRVLKSAHIFPFESACLPGWPNELRCLLSSVHQLFSYGNQRGWSPVGCVFSGRRLSSGGGGFFPLGSNSSSQSLTPPIPSVRNKSPKGFFFFRAVFYAVTGDLFSSKRVESNSLLSVGSSVDFLGDLVLYLSASVYTCCLYLRCCGSS